MVKIVIKQEIKLTSKELAKEFWDMDSNEQAGFFSELAELCGRYSATLETQLAWIIKSEKLTAHGKEIMESIGESTK